MTHPSRLVTRATRATVALLAAGVLTLLPAQARADDPVAGAQTSGDVLFPNVGNGGYDVSHYDIDLVWTPPAVPVVTPDSIAAVTTITAATTGPPLSSYSFDLEGLTVSSVTVNGTAATFARVTDAGATKHKLVVTPATPVDGTFTTVVTYGGTPTSHTDADGSKEGWGRTSDGVIFLNQPVGAMTAFPNNNTPADKATYDVSIDIPSTLLGGAAAAVSNGELVSHVPNTPSSGRTTWVWQQQEQMASMAVLISIGRYTMHDEEIGLASGRLLRELSFIDPSASGASGAETARGNLKAYLDFFETRYGPYPGNSTGIVVDNIAPGSGINYALETQDRAFFPNSVGTSTNIHETMHQWWGDSVSPKVWNDIWLSEGAASYAEVLYPNEGANPPTSSTTTEDANYGLWSSTSAGSANWDVPPAAMTDSADLFGWQTYHRSEMTFEALKAAIGTDDFDLLMQQWTLLAGESPGTAAFIDFAEAIDGHQLDAFFADWLYEPGKPAWPAKFDLTLASAPAMGPVAPGAAVTYTVSVHNTGKVPLTGAVVEAELFELLPHATIDGPLPPGTSLDGTTLTWTVPTTAVGATSTMNLPVTVSGSFTAGTLSVFVEPGTATLGATCTTCTSNLAVAQNPVSPSSVPTIDDTTPEVGSFLTASPGTWAAGTSFLFQWQVDGLPAGGLPSPTYFVLPQDVGKPITVTLTGSKGGFQPVQHESAPTAPVTPIDMVSSPTPTITGTPAVGQTLTAVPGSWDPADADLTYQWRADGVAVVGATATTFQPRAVDLGAAISVSVMGAREGFNTVTRTSAPTAPVTAAQQSSTPTPVVTGTPRVGETLSAAAGTWDPGVTLDYQWSADGTPVPGATAPTYAVPAGDLGRQLSVTVTGSRAGYATVSRTSAPTPAVTRGVLGSAPTPTIRGKAKVGKKLTAVPGQWAPGVTLTYQWFVGTKALRTTGPKLKVKKAWAGKRIQLKVTGVKPGYAAVTTVSKRTAKVVE